MRFTSEQIISLIIPCKNEQDNIEELCRRILKVSRKIKKKFNIKFNIIFIDDGSTDQTIEQIKRTCKESELKITYTSLSRNIGHQKALWEGIVLIPPKSQAAIVIDADLQDPPEVLYDLIERWIQGSADLVVAVRANRKSDSYIKRSSAGIFYWVMKFITGEKIVNAGDFRLMDKTVINALKTKAGKSSLPPLRFLTNKIAIKIDYVNFERATRYAGESKYNLGAMLKLAGSSVFTSGKLTDKWLHFGVLILIVSLLALIFLIVLSSIVLGSETEPGWLSIILVMLIGFLAQTLTIYLLNMEIKKIREYLLIPQPLQSRPLIKVFEPNDS